MQILGESSSKLNQYTRSSNLSIKPHQTNRKDYYAKYYKSLIKMPDISLIF